ncbi:MAG TPA: adenylate/guanylate cyclase domain-containing protein [Polyangiaceae bacterium]|jgi:adenylate cyclase
MPQRICRRQTPGVAAAHCGRGPGTLRRTLRPSLTRLFVLTTLAFALVGGAAFVAFLESSEREIVARSSERREAVARRVEARVEQELQVPAQVVADLQRAMQLGTLSADDAGAVEARLFMEMVDRPTLSDVTLTRATRGAFLWQVTVFRTDAGAESPVWTRRIRRDGALISELRRRPPGGALLAVPFEREGRPVADPTAHLTYSVSLEPANYGRLIWSDLARSELDDARPTEQRRVVLTAQQAIEDAPGRFAGVARAGLLESTIDAIPELGARDVDPQGPERAFLCDTEGRLLTRLEPGDPLVLTGPKKDDLRVAPLHMPPEIAAALERSGTSGSLDAAGVRWLVTFAPVHHTQSWSVGIIAPDTYYTRDLQALRDRFLLALLAFTLLALVSGVAVLRPVRRSLAQVVEATARMRRFDLAPSPTDAPLREVAEIMEGVERAKTSMRTLGKYVPLDLVKQLYVANVEPALGGEMVDLSLMFTDIEGFTSLAEHLPPDALAQALGAYLQAMTDGVQSTQGTVDKFIGDAVMAFWNAPNPAPDHPLRACRAVLACLRKTRELYASEAWSGLKPLVTRYGLHTGRVMVGNFGAPDRLSYTALGDGVNLAARLEGLCKQYGVVTLASEAVVKAVGDAVAFRLVDRVAVKGKQEAVRVYELLESPRSELAPYERAYDAYLARDFVTALDLLRALPDDGPGRVLAARCESLRIDPPPSGWDGVYVAKSK